MTVGDFQDKICVAYEEGEVHSDISDDSTITDAVDTAMLEVFGQDENER